MQTLPPILQQPIPAIAVPITIPIPISATQSSFQVLQQASMASSQNNNAIDIVPYDDKDGHYLITVGDDFTPRCTISYIYLTKKKI